MADRRQRDGRSRFCRGNACRRPQPRQPPRCHQPDGARGLIGLYDPDSGRYTAHVSSQSIHATRDQAARALGVPAAQVRFVAPDVGGGFGAKNFIYPEHVLIPWAARRVGRPVKWIPTRSEALPRQPWRWKSRGSGAVSTHPLNDYGGTVAKNFRSGAFAHNLGCVVTQSHNRIGSHFPRVLNEEVEGLLTCLFAHIRVCPDPSSNDVL